MRWTVGKKIMFGYIIVLLLMLVVSLIATFRLSGINNRLNRVVDVVSTRQLLSAQIKQDVLRINRAEKNLILSTSPEEMDKHEENIDKYEAEMNQRLDQLVSIATPEGKNSVDKFKETYSDWKKIDLEVQNLSRQASNSKAIDLSTGEGRVLTDKIEAEITDIVDRNDEEMVKERKISDKNYVLTRNLLWAILIVAIVISIGTALFITRSLTKSLYIVVNRINEIAGAAGDLTANVAVESKDEIGDLAEAFNKMLAGLKTMVIRILGASGDVSASSQQLSAAAQQTNASVQQVSSAIQQLAKGSQIQAQKVEETANVMEQLNTSTVQSAQSAQQAASASSQASQSAMKGAETVKETISTVDKISDSISVTSEIIKKLSQRSDQMTRIVEMISSVADQSNLLALNASIEAARAGESGKGFAVVAEEMVKLAENSAKFSLDIRELIQQTTKEINDAVKNMEISAKEVTSGKELAIKAGTALEEIVQASENVSTMLQQISAASQQMSSGAKQVVKSMEDVASIAEEASSSTQQAGASTQQMAATMQEMASSAQSLAQMGIDLDSLVAEFKTGEEERRAGPELRAPTPRPAYPSITKRFAEAKRKMRKTRRPERPETEEEVKTEESKEEEKPEK